MCGELFQPQNAPPVFSSWSLMVLPLTLVRHLPWMLPTQHYCAQRRLIRRKGFACTRTRKILVVLCFSRGWRDFWWEPLRCGVDRSKWWCSIFLKPLLLNLNSSRRRSALAPTNKISWSAKYEMAATTQKFQAGFRYFLSFFQAELCLTHGQTLVVAQGLSAKLPIVDGQAYKLSSWSEPASVVTSSLAPSNGFAFENKVFASVSIYLSIPEAGPDPVPSVSSSSLWLDA